jgi:hypothetical protein
MTGSLRERQSDQQPGMVTALIFQRDALKMQVAVLCCR